MLVKLHLGNKTTAGRGKALCKIIGGLLTQEYTNFNNTGSFLYTSGNFDPKLCWFYSGTSAYTPWTLIADNTSGTTGSYTVSKTSTVTGKTLYLGISYTTTGAKLTISNTADFAVSSQAPLSYSDLTLAVFINEASGFSNGPHTIYVKITDTAIVVLPGTLLDSSCNNVTYANNLTAAFEWAGSPYDGYSQESGMRLFNYQMTVASPSTSHINSLYTVNKYNPYNNTHTSGSSSLNNANLLIKAGTYGFDDVNSLLHAENLIDNRFPLVPIVFADYATGYLPVNVSQATGLYATCSPSSAMFHGGELVVQNSQNHILCRLSNGGFVANYLCRF